MGSQDERDESAGYRVDLFVSGVAALCLRRPVAALGVSLALISASDSAFAQTSASPFTSAIRYDGDHRVVGTIAPDPDGSGPLHHLAVRTSYDDGLRTVTREKGELSGWQDESVAPASWSGFSAQQRTVTELDALDRKMVERVSGWESGGWVLKAVTQYSYDTSGRLECTAVRMNLAAALPTSACTLATAGSFGADRITRNLYDAAGQLLKVQKAYGTALQEDYSTFTYSANGKPLSMVDANGNVAAMSYDGFDRQRRWYMPDAATVGVASTTDYEEYDYDANGNRTSLRRRDGRVLTYSYDALDRMTTKVVPDGCPPIQLTTCVAATIPASATRDVYYGYDLQGHQTYARFDSTTGEGIANSYDGMGRLTSTTSTMGGVTRTIGHGYDADGNRAGTTFPDSAQVQYQSDGLDRLEVGELGQWRRPARAPDLRQYGPARADASYLRHLGVRL